MGFMDSIKAKYDLYRLEQRYTRRDKRKTFASGAQYVDGEYVYVNSPTSSTTSNNSWGSTMGGNPSNKRTASVRVRDLMSKGTKA